MMQVVLPETAAELADLIDAATERLAVVGLSRETDHEMLDVLNRWETSRRKADSVSARLLIEASDRNLDQLAGYLTVPQLLATGLRLGRAEAARRRTVAHEIGRYRNLQGELLPPRLPLCAQAVAEGAIDARHVDAIVHIMAQIPAAVGQTDRDRAEQILTDAARNVAPDDLPMLGNRILAHLDPDGHLTDDADRRRQRGFTLRPQDRRLMSKVRALLTPELRAKLEVILTVWAAPGMNNPADPDSPHGAADRPDLDPADLEAAAGRDDRLPAQRNHDALLAMCDYLLGHGALGRPDRIPAQLVITTTEAELAARAGTAVTATGSRVPVADLVDLAADATPWLEVFADHSAAILYLGRGRRLATLAQRLALFGRDRGCTMPGCRRPFAQTEAHHLPAWQHGGPTDVDHLGAACGPHNRREGHSPGQWESTILADGPDAGRVAWRPAGRDAPWRVNPLHHPELLIRPALLPDPPPLRRRRDHGSVVERLLSCDVRIHRPPIVVDFHRRE
ncbi:HNH endonuclease [Gordonia alkaliphila]|uniref:HNH endonuclease signature motif containing protein n=1 Tax=Gordonia alkaliphila TaxID=1053547 RepID=UPI001FF5EF07|nr:HNH endonuclease signature motif containing protein [Gordonia alkaliphila]MCK0440913.1 HNH endonuclease [Gordonia alkaliphila]